MGKIEPGKKPVASKLCSNTSSCKYIDKGKPPKRASGQSLGVPWDLI